MSLQLTLHTPLHMNLTCSGVCNVSYKLICYTSHITQTVLNYINKVIAIYTTLKIVYYGILCTDSLCASYFERVIQNMWSQRGHIRHVGKKLYFRKVQNKYIVSNFNIQNCQYTLQCTSLRF